MYVLRVNGDNYRIGFLGYLSRSVIVKVPGGTDGDRLCVPDRFLKEGKQFVIVVREDLGWD